MSYNTKGKRVLDLVLLVLAGFLLLAPMALVAFLLLVIQGRPVFFKQIRPGLNGNPFALYKFRTMSDARNAHGEIQPDEARLTAIGRFLRSTSLDELPELLNVLKGEMSLVGPRPLLVQYLSLYSPVQMRRHEVLPGITGWAQVNGRNALSWEEKFNLDVWYVDHQSLWLDLKIIALTIGKVFSRQGISGPGHATAEEFKGTFPQGQI